MARNIRVHVPAGTTEANVGTDLYTADADGVIEASEADAIALLQVPGFTVDVPEPPPVGFVRVIAPDVGASCSFGGHTYVAGADGSLIVPAEAASQLEAHGFTAAPVVPDVVLAPEPVTEPEPVEPAPTPEPVVEPVTEPEPVAA